ncbi:MAG TPA: ester cyclase, partial [Thermomicrobiales bacterium]|nr:ester cyclase [Thermomicrobiales bacterium]
EDRHATPVVGRSRVRAVRRGTARRSGAAGPRRRRSNRLHVGGRPDVVDSAGLRFLVAEYRAAFPDLTLRIDGLRVDGARATARWTPHGTFLGPFADLAPTGRPFNAAGAFVFRAAGDQIVETWVDADTDAALRQTGALPAAAASAWEPPTLVESPGEAAAGAPAVVPIDLDSDRYASS